MSGHATAESRFGPTTPMLMTSPSGNSSRAAIVATHPWLAGSHCNLTASDTCRTFPVKLGRIDSDSSLAASSRCCCALGAEPRCLEIMHGHLEFQLHCPGSDAFTGEGGNNGRQW